MGITLFEMKTLKQQLLGACQNYVVERERTVNQTISSHQKALSSETKSSAGDKHETGRAMLQLEMEKAGQQLTAIDQMKSVLAKIKLKDKHTHVKLGSLVTTDQNNYFLAISSGEILIENQKYYAISSASPIGQLLLGKKVGDEIVFNKSMVILEVF